MGRVWDVDERVLEAVGGRNASSSGWVRANCPFCEEVDGKADRKQSFGLNTETAYFRCFRCATWGFLSTAPDDADLAHARQREERKAERPPEFLPLAEEPACSAICLSAARAYLQKRGVGPRLIREAQIGACLEGRYAGRIVIPVISREGEWLGHVARTWTTSSRPYLNAQMSAGLHMYNEAALDVETDEPVLAVEGCFDALAVWPHGVGFLGKPSEPQIQALIRTPRPVAVVLDGDAWEEAWALAIRLRFAGQRAGFVRLPPKKDPDQVDRAWLFDEARKCLSSM